MNVSIAAPTQSVVARYDELAALLAWWRAAGPSLPDDPDTAAAAAAELVAEARLLDDERFDSWLAGWSADALLWVPLDATHHPGADQSLYLDDRRRLGERLRWRAQQNAWSQHPAPRTVRAVGNVEAVLTAGDVMRVRSVVVIHEQRAHSAHVWAGHQYHELVGGDDGRWLRRLKVIDLPTLRAPVDHPSVVL